MLRIVVNVAMLVTLATSSLAWVNLEATCAGGQAQIYLRIGNTYGPEFVGLVVTRYQMGTCETPAIVTDSPVPLPSGSQVLRFSVPAPSANVFYRFEAKLIDTDGVLHAIPGEYIQGLPQIPIDLASDGDAVVIRGHLSVPSYPTVVIAPCADGCWGEQTESFVLTRYFSSPLIWYALAGMVVDVVGYHVEPEGMSGPDYDIFMELVQIAPAGSCGVVADESVSWGTLKAGYR